MFFDAKRAGLSRSNEQSEVGSSRYVSRPVAQTPNGARPVQSSAAAGPNAADKAYLVAPAIAFMKRYANWAMIKKSVCPMLASENTTPL